MNELNELNQTNEKLDEQTEKSIKTNKNRNSKKVRYNIESWSTELIQLYPQFGFNVKRGINKDSRYIIHQLDNPYNTKYPLIVTMYEKDGIYVDYGIRNNVLEAEHHFNSKVLTVIDCILNDKAYSVCVFKDAKNYNHFYPSHTSFFINCENKHYNNMTDFKKLLLKLSKPTTSLKNRFTPYKGIIEITNWSTSSYKLLKR